jgi:hypothetical protein
MDRNFALVEAERKRLKSFGAGVVFFWLFTWFSTIFGLGVSLSDQTKEALLPNEEIGVLVLVMGIVLWNILLRLMLHTKCPRCKKSDLKIAFFFKSFSFRCKSCDLSIEHEELLGLET